MKKILFTLFLLIFAVSCQKKADTIPESPKKAPEAVCEPTIDEDSLFCEKIKSHILLESEKWPVSYVFEKLESQFRDNVRYNNDFDYGYNIIKEVHYFTKDKSNPFSKIEVDYYVLSQQKNAIELIKDYKRITSGVEDGFTYGRVIGEGHMKIPTFLYRKGSTIFHIRTDNGVAHIVSGALQTLNEVENIDESDAAPYMQYKKEII